jgi:hypothetical protein
MSCRWSQFQGEQDKALEEFTKEVRNILQFKKTIKNAMVVLVEMEVEK